MLPIEVFADKARSVYVHRNYEGHQITLMP